MSGSPDFEVVLSCPHGLAASQVLVDFSRCHDRLKHPDSQQEELIEKTWQERKSRQPALYNGTKFRYAGFKELETSATAGDAVGGPATKVTNLKLKLGLTDYKDFVGTNLREDWTELLASPADASGAPSAADAERHRHLADPLGNAALVRTRDGQALLLQRGQAVGEFPNCPVFPGGHSEPVEVGISGHQEVLYTEDEKTQLNNLIGLEMFAGIVREVEEETGAPADTLSNVRLLGVCRRTKNARPVAMFVCDCSLSAAEVEECYKSAEHKFESTRIRAVPLESLVEESRDMPGCHKGGCFLAMSFLQHEKEAH